MGLVRQFAAEMVGRWALHFVLFSVPLLLLAPLLGVDPRPASPPAGALFVLSLCLAILVGLAMDVLFGALTVALEQPVWLIEYVRAAVATLLSGALLPLAYYPWGLGDVFAWLPFAAMAWAPLAIYTGTGDPLPLLASQVVLGGRAVAAGRLAVARQPRKAGRLWRLKRSSRPRLLRLLAPVRHAWTCSSSAARARSVALAYYVSDLVIGAGRRHRDLPARRALRRHRRLDHARRCSSCSATRCWCAA